MNRNKTKHIPIFGPILTFFWRIYYKASIIIVKIWHYVLSKKYTLIKDPSNVFEVVSVVQGKTWNTMYTPEIFGLSKERTITAVYPELEFYRINDAILTYESDTVRWKNYVWWDKYNDEDFVSLAQPKDCNVMTFDGNSVRIVENINKEHISGPVISLIGVFSYAWSHFLFEFICKLFFAGEAGLLNRELTLLTDDYHDENIEYIINNYLKNFPLVKRLIIKKNVDYVCEELLAIRCTGTNYNEAKVFWDYRLVIPQIVTDKLHYYISYPLIDKIKDNPVKHKKLFLARRSNRKLKNNNEIEAYFREQGFYFVEGFELSLEEKVDIFYHAEIIVGLHSSAWQNIIFCNNAKCLMLVNNRYAPEMLFYTMAKENVQSWLNVCGQDDNESRRTDFYIPLEKIKNAYHSLISNS